MARKKTLGAALCLALLIAGSRPASATIPVYDYVNWALAWYQRAEQIKHQYDQVVTLKRQLESFGEGGDWNSLNGLLGDLDKLFRGGENLGYLLAGVEEVFEETFPGYELPVSWPDEYQLRVGRSRETLRLITAALNRLTWANTHSQIMVDRIQERSRTANSPLEELEVLSMWTNLSISEQQRHMQASLLAANAIVVAQAEAMQRQASIEAARNDWLARENTPVAGHDPSDGFTGVPADWPWSL